MSKNILYFLGLLIMALSIHGCAKTCYVIHLRDNESEKPMSNVQVTLASIPRMYSFLDIRHYGAESGKPDITKGITNSTGVVELSLPQDIGVGYIMVNDVWILIKPSVNWTKMQIRDDLKPEQRDGIGQTLPEVKIEKK